MNTITHRRYLMKSTMKHQKHTDTPIRESNFELLRIVSMIIILAYHTFRYIDTSHFTPWQMLAYHGVRWYGLFGVNCFLLISAWFMVGKPIKTRRLFGIILQTAFYCILLFLCHILYNILCGTFDPIKDIVNIELTSLFSPLWSDRYWFITTYVFLYLLIPFLNKLIQSLSAGSYRRFILIFSLFLFLYMTLPQTFENTTVICNLLWFIYVYLLTGYLKLYCKDNFLQRHAGILLPVTYILFVLSKQLQTYVIHNYYLNTLIGRTTGNNMRFSFIMLLLAIELFYLFQRIHMKNRLINTIASFMFGVYLFHDNKVFHICELLAIKLINPFLKAIPSLAFFMFILVIVQFITGCLIELFRQRVIQKNLEPYIYNKLKDFFSQMDRWLNQL